MRRTHAGPHDDRDDAQATQAEIEAVQDRLAQTGVHVVVMPGELTTAIGAIGDPEGVAELGLEGMGGVDRVVPISRPYKLASSELNHFEPTVVEVGGRRVGGPARFCLIAGPCTVESREQTLGVARAVRDGGASDAARRRVQAAHVAVRLQGPRARGPRDPGRGAGADGAARRHRAARRPARRRRRRARRRRADRRAQHAELRAAGGRRQAGQAGPAQARPVLLARRAPPGRRLRAQGGQRPTSSSASAGSGPSRRRRASRSTWAPCPGSSSTRTCP